MGLRVKERGESECLLVMSRIELAQLVSNISSRENGQNSAGCLLQKRAEPHNGGEGLVKLKGVTAR